MATAIGPVSAEAAEALLSALSAALDHPVALDASGQCTLLFDGGIEITLAVAPEADRLLVRSDVMRPAADDAALLRAALAANCGRLPPGVALALDDGSGQLVLACLIGLAGAGDGDLVAVVADFVALVPLLRAELVPAGVPPARADDEFDGRMIRG